MYTDKLADAKAKAAVRQQIEADKRARADKAAREKALRDGNALPPPSADPTPVAPPRATGEKKVYDQTRLQIRLPTGGQPLVHSMSTSATLADLVAWTREQPSAAGLERIVFSSTFPRLIVISTSLYDVLIQLQSLEKPLDLQMSNALWPSLVSPQVLFYSCNNEE